LAEYGTHLADEKGRQPCTVHVAIQSFVDDGVVRTLSLQSCCAKYAGAGNTGCVYDEEIKRCL